MQIRSFRFARWTAALSLGVVAVTVFGAEVERPFGPTDPFRPYDQPMPNTPETTAYHEGLYLHADVGISLMRDTSSIKTDPGARFSFGPGYTLHSSELFEVGAQFETGLIYNHIRRREQILFTPPSTTTFVSERGDAYQVPFLGDIVYAFHVEPNLVPYFGFGGGVVYRDFVSPSLPDRRSTDPAFQAMAGLRFKLNEQQEIGVGYKFLVTFPSDSNIQTHSLSAAWVVRF